jgi:hypothetical protein
LKKSFAGLIFSRDNASYNPDEKILQLSHRKNVPTDKQQLCDAVNEEVLMISIF